MFQQHVPKQVVSGGAAVVLQRESVEDFALRIALAAGVLQRCAHHPWTVFRGAANDSAATQLARYEQALGRLEPVAFESEVWAALAQVIALHRAVRCEDCDAWHGS